MVLLTGPYDMSMSFARYCLYWAWLVVLVMSLIVVYRVYLIYEVERKPAITMSASLLGTCVLFALTYNVRITWLDAVNHGGLHLDNAAWAYYGWPGFYLWPAFLVHQITRHFIVSVWTEGFAGVGDGEPALYGRPLTFISMLLVIICTAAAIPAIFWSGLVAFLEDIFGKPLWMAVFLAPMLLYLALDTAVSTNIAILISRESKNIDMDGGTVFRLLGTSSLHFNICVAVSSALFLLQLIAATASIALLQPDSDSATRAILLVPAALLEILTSLLIMTSISTALRLLWHVPAEVAEVPTAKEVEMVQPGVAAPSLEVSEKGRLLLGTPRKNVEEAQESRRKSIAEGIEDQRIFVRECTLSPEILTGCCGSICCCAALFFTFGSYWLLSTLTPDPQNWIVLSSIMPGLLQGVLLFDPFLLYVTLITTAALLARLIKIDPYPAKDIPYGRAHLNRFAGQYAVLVVFLITSALWIIAPALKGAAAFQLSVDQAFGSRALPNPLQTPWLPGTKSFAWGCPHFCTTPWKGRYYKRKPDTTVIYNDRLPVKPAGVVTGEEEFPMYKEPEELTIDIYYPDEERWPVPEGGYSLYLHIHGGGYLSHGTERRYNRRFMHYLNERGVAFSSIRYRLTQHGWNYWTIIGDIYSGLAYLKRNSTELSLDPEKIIVGGQGAGAGLALVAGLRAKEKVDVDVKGIMNFYAWQPFDWQPVCKYNPAVFYTLFRPEFRSNVTQGDAATMAEDHWHRDDDFDERELADHKQSSSWDHEVECVKRPAFASPGLHIRKDSPPYVTIHGQADGFVLYRHAEDLDRKATAEGHRSHVSAYPIAEKHGCDNFEPANPCLNMGLYALERMMGMQKF